MGILICRDQNEPYNQSLTKALAKILGENSLPLPYVIARKTRGPLIERHWDGIAAYCKPENKVALGFVEGLNNKIRVLQRRAYGLRDEQYLRLKVLTCMLPAL